MSEKKIMLGNEAIARGAWEAGVKVSSAYPGTPSTEVSENLAKYEDVYSEWAPNEKVATEVAIGASMAGVRSMTMMKMVGLNVAADPLFTQGYIGVNGGMVYCVADDPGIYSSQNEQDTRMIARAAMVPLVEPSDSEEARTFTKKAYELNGAVEFSVPRNSALSATRYGASCMLPLILEIRRCISLPERITALMMRHIYLPRQERSSFNGKNN